MSKKKKKLSKKNKKLIRKIFKQDEKNLLQKYADDYKVKWIRTSFTISKKDLKD